MRFSKSCLFAFLATHAANAAPVADDASTSLVEYRSVNEAHLALTTLEKRASCRLLNHAIHKIGTSASTVIYITLLSTSAELICEIAGGPHCDKIGKLVAVAFQILYVLAANHSGAIPEGVPVKRGLDPAASIEFWQSTLSSNGIQVDAVEFLPYDEAEATLARRGDEPRLVSRVRLLGVANRETGEKHDVIANHFENGNINLHLPVAPLVGEAHTLSKRFDGRGLKFSYTTREPSKLTEAHQNEMARMIAADWVAAAETSDMSEYIGLAKTEHKANFYFRIIPELSGFGLNYESVDVCGGMAGYL